ncbi:HAD family phosphatase [Candidatus Saccharibacteria bacterium]|nr:HAD family phosphatase [Candidatus Saccharibacteria bacterium]
MILFCDFDGTLFRRDIEGDFERNLEAIQRFREAGNKFVLTTGRGLASVMRQFPEYKEYFDYLICDNGAQCFDADGIHFEYTISEKDTQDIIEFVKQQRGGESPYSVFYRNGAEYAEGEGAHTKIRFWFTTDEEMFRIYDALVEKFAESGIRFFTGHGLALSLINFTRDDGYKCLIDAVSADAGKDTAFQRIVDEFPGEIATAVGDGNNDLPMLRKYDGYIMKNALPEYQVDFDDEHRVDSAAGLIDRLLEKH